MTSFKLLSSQAQNINQYKNLRTKVAKCCANVGFNKQCLYSKVVPKYAQLKIPNTSPASHSTAPKNANNEDERRNKILTQEERALT